MAKLGGANGGNFVKKENFKIKDGDNTFRIFPSIGLNGKEPNGKWSVFHRVHFGYKNSEGKMRVFESPLQKNKEKMVTAPDAALERIEKLKAELEKAKDSGNKALQAKIAPLISGQKPLYNLDSNHHMNVITEDGKIGVLKLRHKGKLALDAEIKRLRSEGVEPLSAENGRFFVITRTGSGLETTYSCRVKQQTVQVNGRSLKDDVVHVIDDAIINRLDSEAGDLENLFPKLTSDEVALIVKESELTTGKSPAIDRIFAKKGATTAAAATEETSEEEYNDEESSSSAGISTQTQAPAQTTAKAAEPEAAQQSLSQPTQTKAKLAETPAPKPEQSVTEMSDEEFLKSLGA